MACSCWADSRQHAGQAKVSNVEMLLPLCLAPHLLCSLVRSIATGGVRKHLLAKEKALGEVRERVRKIFYKEA
jgi:hypothetical protein